MVDEGVLQRMQRAVFGEAFRCKEAGSWGVADEAARFTDARHGRVELQLWRGLGLRRKGKFVEVVVMRSQIHAESEKPPQAHWYVAYNGKPEQEVRVRDWYETIAHRWGRFITLHRNIVTERPPRVRRRPP